MGSAFFRSFLLFTMIGLYGCSTSMNAPVEDLGRASRYQQSLSPNPSAYTVVKGDTLFSIALRYDLDYKKLAQANSIYPPYIIRPNDTIYLRESSVAAPVSGTRVAVYPVDKPVVVQTTKNAGVIPAKRVKENQVERLPVVKNEVAVVRPLPVMQPPIKTDNHLAISSFWIWPVSGSVLRQFSPQDALSKGIDIGGAMGAPVRAARAGEVVYAGSGLKGYGNLIIIRHDDTYISAYAHNRTMLVKEGQTVKQGDTIAELGMTGTQMPKLHFEIREHGKPIDPLKLLPAK